MALGGGGVRPGRAGPDGGAADLPPVRGIGDAERGPAVSGPARDPARHPGASWAWHGRPGVASAEPDDAPEPAAEPDLRRRLRLWTPAGRPASAATWASEQRSAGDRSCGVGGAAAGP